MIVRLIMFFVSLIVFTLCTLLMYGELKSNRRKIDKSVKNKKRQFENQYQKSYK